MKSNAAIQRLSQWKLKFKLSPNNFFLLLSVAVGIVAGLAAVALKQATGALESLLQVYERSGNFVLLISPVIGILLATTYTWVFRKGKLGRGISNVIENIDNKCPTGCLLHARKSGPANEWKVSSSGDPGSSGFGTKA